MPKNQSPEYQRNAYIRVIQKTLIEQIFKTYHAEQRDLLEDLIRENTRLLNAHSLSFMYNGVFYRSVACARNKDDNRIIHPSMMNSITVHLENKNFNHAQQKSQIENYVANSLIFAKHLSDLFELFPDKFHFILKEINGDWFNISSPASEAEIDQFKKLNRRGLVEFQRMFLAQLLMS
jgi:hypothetical protein